VPVLSAAGIGYLSLNPLAEIAYLVTLKEEHESTGTRIEVLYDPHGTTETLTEALDWFGGGNLPKNEDGFVPLRRMETRAA